MGTIFVLTKARTEQGSDRPEVSVVAAGTLEACVEAARKEWEAVAEHESIGEFEDDVDEWGFSVDDSTSYTVLMEVHETNLTALE